MKEALSAGLLCIAMGAGSANAQAPATVAAPSASTGPLREGQTFKAEQSCARSPGDGVVMSVLSVPPDGRTAKVAVEVRCWGNDLIIANNRYFGGITADGSSIRIVLTGSSNPRYGTELNGTWQPQADKPLLQFGGATLVCPSPHTTKGLVFR